MSACPRSATGLEHEVAEEAVGGRWASAKIASRRSISWRSRAAADAGARRSPATSPPTPAAVDDHRDQDQRLLLVGVVSQERAASSQRAIGAGTAPRRHRAVPAGGRCRRPLLRRPAARRAPSSRRRSLAFGACQAANRPDPSWGTPRAASSCPARTTCTAKAAHRSRPSTSSSSLRTMASWTVRSPADGGRCDARGLERQQCSRSGTLRRSRRRRRVAALPISVRSRNGAGPPRPSGRVGDHPDHAPAGVDNGKWRTPRSSIWSSTSLPVMSAVTIRAGAVITSSTTASGPSRRRLPRAQVAVGDDPDAARAEVDQDPDDPPRPSAVLPPGRASRGGT